MKYFAGSLFNYIQKQIEAHLDRKEIGKKLLFVLPSFPASVVVEVGNLLEDFCINRKEFESPLIKIAFDLHAEWSKDKDTSQLYEEARRKKWLDEFHNLTRYRNLLPENSDKYVVSLLVGIDRITDSSSLSDFHLCSVSNIWEIELNKSFIDWVGKKFTSSHIAFEKENLNHFDQVLKPLVKKGISDIIQISQFLGNLNLAEAQDGKDAEEILLTKLKPFGLPSFRQYNFKKNNFGFLVEQALSFFSYSMFLEPRTRKTALNKIDKLLEGEKEKIEINEYFDDTERFPFNNDKELINSVKSYIEKESIEEKNKLYLCDFNGILDKILKYKTPKNGDGPSKTESVRKLTGSPIEVILTGLWDTLSEFKNHSNQAESLIDKITIETVEFKHDFEGTAEDKKNQALPYLKRLLGGVDELINQGILIKKSPHEDETVVVQSDLIHHQINLKSSYVAEPYIQFAISIQSNASEKTTTKKFAWRLPEIEPYRLSDELIQWAAELIDKEEDYCLPIFNFPYYEELFQAKDDEETRRVLKHCIEDEESSVFNLLGIPEIEKSDQLYKKLEELAFNYDKFIQHARENGLHSAIEISLPIIRKAYEEASGIFRKTAKSGEDALASLLFKSFLVLQNRNDSEGYNWAYESYESSGIITILHPALLEMIQSRNLFLLTCFNSAANEELRAPGLRTFQSSIWQNYLDLSTIQMPLCGLLQDSHKIINTNVIGENLIYKIGNLNGTRSSLSTRLFIRYDQIEEEEISDKELFRESRESLLLYKILNDYKQIHPHAKNDGINIAIYQNEDIQPIIAAIDKYLKEVLKDRINQNNPYYMAVTIFTESSDDSSVTRWINQWKERWEAAENQSNLAHYRQSYLSISHRIVTSKNEFYLFRKIIETDFQSDVIFLNRFIGAGSKGNEFEVVEPYDVTSLTLKFPILEKSFCTLKAPGKSLERARVLSNRQFRLSSSHVEIMARLKHKMTPEEKEHVVIGIGDYSPWRGVIDSLHNKSEWVVCIDPSIDERLISQKGENQKEEREIIGFGSGVGSHGEDNYTVSTEQYRLSDINYRLALSIKEVFDNWDEDVYSKFAESILRENRSLSGLSLVRATGLGQYIRDYVAYALTRKIFKSKSDDILCDQIVTLDAYSHWFDSAPTKIHPDLLWLVAYIDVDGIIKIEIKLIECKLAKKYEIHLEKAKQQLEQGLNHLINKFSPRASETEMEDERPDQRYWWLQLHRLISSKSEITEKERRRILKSLEDLSQGNYDIEWSAAAVAYWTDQHHDKLELSDSWSYDYQDKKMAIHVISAGSEYVKNLCQKDIHPEIPAEKSTIYLSHPGKKSKNKSEDTQGGEETEPSPKPTESGKTLPETKDTGFPNRILLGKTIHGSRNIFWEFGHPDLGNRHIIIFGASGMGKSYTIQCLLYELSKSGQNSLIVDYTGGFSDDQIENEIQTHLNPEQHYIKTDPLSINPFRRHSQRIGNKDIPDDPISIAERVTGVFSEVYNFGDQQKSAIYSAIKEGIRESGNEGMSMSDLIPQLNKLTKQGGAKASAAESVISKIQPFIDQASFGKEDPESWEKLYSDKENRCHILQLMGFMKDASKLITEFSLIDLYRFYRGRGSKDKPKILVLDEIQNLDQREKSPLAQLLTEGRKFGFSLILATQIMSNLDKDQRDRLFNAAHKLFFKPADTEMGSYARIAEITTGEKAEIWKNRLANLKKGECYSLGPSLNTSTEKLDTKIFHIHIKSLEERINE